MKQTDLLYGPRFLDDWAGSIVSSPSTAIVELVANCWDAYASEVKITWPSRNPERHFSIVDNGKGMTFEEFDYIWRTLSYDRIKQNGSNTTNPPPGLSGLPRPVFGKNGKGRFASFCFADEYLITSRKDGQEFTCRVFRSLTTPLGYELINRTTEGVKGHGTEIRGVGEPPQIGVSEEQAREIIGGRFLANPSFHVFVNDRQVTFSDISKNCLSITTIEIPGVGTARLLHIDTKKADKTTKQHGIAWWVLNRAVGECRWSGSDVTRILDGRTSEAKRYTFIVQADFLKERDAVLEDWSWFREDNETWIKTRETVQRNIKQIISQSNKAERDERRQSVMNKIGGAVNALPPLSKDRVSSFVSEVIDSCPSLGEQEILQLSTILTNLERSKSRYGLLEILHNQAPDDLDALHDVLNQWTVGMAKLVLDEIQSRLRLIEELRVKIEIAGIDEVHELQPLFEKGLWMFGPQFESIEFTSNKGMTTVIRSLFKDKAIQGSRSRPDFVVLPDASIGFYAQPSYDEDYNENGIGHVVIVDLKTTNLPIGTDEKAQVWKYVKELQNKGLILESTRVDGFVLGTVIEPGETKPTKQGDNVVINPLLYQTILKRAEARLLNLHQRVKSAPFMDELRCELESFTSPIPVAQPGLALDPQNAEPALD